MRDSAERRLETPLDLYRVVFDDNPGLVAISDPDTGLHLDVNDTWLTTLGYNREDVIGKTVDEFGLWQDPIQRSEMVSLLIRDGVLKNFEARFLRKDRSVCHVLVSGRVIVLQGHRRFLLIGQDVTEIKVAYNALRDSRDELELQVMERTQQLQARVEEYRYSQESLRESENRFRVFAETASDWYWETDADHRFIWFSARLQNQLTDADVDLRGRVRWELGGKPSDIAKWERHREDLTAQRPFRDFQYKTFSLAGVPKWISTSGDPHFDRDGKFLGYRGTARDITKSVLARQEIESARAEAERANAAKSHFLAHMSHELRTPLNAIIGFAQLLEMSAEDNGLLSAEEAEFVGHIRASGEHLLSLISNVLDLSKIEAGGLDVDIETVDLRDTLDDCVSIVRRLADAAGISLSVSMEDDRPTIALADPLRLRQVVLNLMSNAVKYNRPGGDVAVLCGKGAGAGTVRVRVRDTGYGIPKGFRDTVFSPFSRDDGLRRRVDGAGIGLTITKELVDRMGGAIGFDTEEGKGSEFWVELPRAKF